MNYIDPKQSEVIARLDAQIRTGWVTQIQALYLLGVGRNKFRQIRGEFLEEKKDGITRYKYRDIINYLNE